jgi:hypothetical protein
MVAATTAGSDGSSAPVGHACTHSPHATHVLSPIGSSRSKTIFASAAAVGVADDVVDLHFAARAHAARALDARVEADLDAGVREVRRRLRALREARVLDAEAVRPVDQLRVGVVRRAGVSASSSSTTTRCDFSARGARRAARSCRPSARRQHDGASTRSPSTSTMHARQLPSGRMPSV